LLADGLYQVIATLTDAAGNSATDPGVDDLVVDTLAPVTPGVTSLVTNDTTPVVSGTAIVGVGETLTVEVNGVVYTAGDGNLVDNGDGTWDLTIPASDALPEANYNVTASVTDIAGNVSTDPSSAELTIDLTAPVAPAVDAQLSNSPTPTVTGTAVVASGDTLTVEINGVTYTAGDGNLVDNADGTWTLAIPVVDALVEAFYDVTVTVTDSAGNSTSDATVDELEIDLTATVAPTPILTADANNDALLSSAEALAVQPVDITLPPGATVGDVLTLDDGTISVDFVLTAADLVSGVVSTTVALPADGTVLTVTARLTDQAGNVSPDGSDDALVDLTPPGAPIIIITEDANNDGFINVAESAAPINVQISLPSSATVGDDLTFILSGVSTTQTLSAVNITSGVVNVNTPTPAHGAVVVAESFITDPSGNSSIVADDQAVMDLSPPFVPTVNALTTNTGTPVLTGSAAVGPGDILRVTVNGVTYTAGDGNLVDNGDGTWALTIPAANSLADNTYDVSVALEDPAGNITLDATVDELIVDLQAPVIPTSDSLLTNLPSPTLTGTATAAVGEVLTVTVNGVTYTDGDGNLSLNASGLWTLVIPSGDALTDGTYDVTAEITDAAGNVSVDVTSGELIVDLTPPPIPSVTQLLTNNPTPVVSGSAVVAPGDVLTVVLNGVMYTAGDGNLVDNGDGTWDLTVPATDALSDAIYDVLVTVTDSAGNASVDVTLDELVVDLTPPPAPGVTSQTTQDTTPLISGTTTVGSGLVLTVSVNGVTYLAGDGNLVDNNDGTWDLTIPAADAMVDGLYQVVATLTDAAGNASLDPGIDDLVIDTLAPPTPGVTSLVTNDTTPIVSGTATVGAGEVLTVEINGITYTAGDGNLVDNADGTWDLSIPATDALPEANYNVTATVTDIAGNLSVDPSSSELTIDLTAPVAPTVDAQLSNSGTPVITGTATVNPGDVLTVIVNGVVYTAGDGNLVDNADGTWSLAIPVADVLAEAFYDVTATVLDPAGNSTSDGSVDELEIDLTPPGAPTPTLVADANNDALLSTAEATNPQPVDISLPADAKAGDILTLSDGTVNVDFTLTAADIAAAVVSTTVALVADGSTLTVTAYLTDMSGNLSGSNNDSAVVDLSDPDAPVIVIAEDANNDGFININESNASVDIVVTLPASAVAGDELTIVINGVASAQVLTAADIALGAVSTSSPTPAHGATVVVETYLTDPAGNSSSVSDDQATLDISAPFVPTVNSLVTNTGTPAVTGTAAVGPGDSLSVTVNGVTYTAGDGNLVDNGDGTWALSIPASDALVDNTYDVVVQILDPAGNLTSDASLNELIVDLVAPVLPTADALLTNSATPGLTGTATLGAGETLMVTVNGVTYTEGDGNLSIDANGVWTLVVPAGDSLVDGTYPVTVSVADAAGNVTVDTTIDELVVDLTAPVLPTVTSLLTNDATPIVSGTASVSAGDLLTVSVNGVLYTEGDGNLVDNGDGTWSLSIPAGDALTDGFYDVAVSVTDPAGNTSIDNSTDELEVDLTSPPAPAVTSQTTQDTTPLISGNVAAGAGYVLTVEVNGVLYNEGDGNLVVNGDGTWDLTIPAADALTDGLYQVLAVLTDAAGNSASDPGVDDLVVDTTAPPTPGVTSLVTNDTTPVILGTANVGAGETLTVEVNGITFVAGDGNLLDNGDGTWTLTIPGASALPEGNYDVTASITDIAGNVSTDPSSDELVVDLTLPTVPAVDAQQANSGTPVITGTATVLPGETFTVTVNGVTYTAGDGSLVLNADGTWSLTIPAADALPEGSYSVTATITDAAGNVTSDASVGELTIDLTAPVVPMFIDQLSNTSTPTIGGQVQLQPGEVFTVTVNGVVYSDGDGFLSVDVNGNWTLNIDPSQPLSDGVYDVVLNIQDAAGNTISNMVGEQLTIDTNAPDLDANPMGVVASYRPPIGGTTSAADGSIVTVRDANGNIICTAVVTNGQWSCTPTADLAEGPHQFVAEVVDPAGNIATAIIDFTVSSDFDGDGIPNLIEGFGDTDGDGVPDSADLDADNDGLPDALESTGDADGDGQPDYLDGDADNDGMADIIEAQGLDADGSYTVDNFVDNNGDGLSDDLQAFPLSVPDTDADGVPDYLDVDADNDGVPDLQENQGVDTENNGRLDDFVDADGDGVDDGIQALPMVVLDTDGDGIPDYLDSDSDNDGLSDLFESRGLDVDDDMIVDEMLDEDRDSIPDSVDFSVIGGLDADGDDIEDSADVDFVSEPDTDGDGIIDSMDPDADGDGFYDDAIGGLGHALPDANIDGTPDFQQALDGVLITGLNGRGGCSINPAGTAGRDPFLLILVLTAVALLSSRRSKALTKRARSRRSGTHWVLTAMFLSVFMMSSDDAIADSAGEFHKRWYLGAGVGASYLEPDTSEIPFSIEERTDFSWNGYVGYDLGSRVSLELGFNDMGRAELTDDHHVDYRQRSLSFLVYGLNRKAMREKRLGLAGFARIGVSQMINHSDIVYRRDNDFSLLIGLGVEIGFKKGLALRGELTSFDVDSNHAGISLVYRFGHGSHDEALAVATPIEKVNKPAVLPKIAEPVEPISESRVSFARLVKEFVVRFDTNSWKLNSKSESVIAEIVEYLGDNPEYRIVITGYADTRGSKDKNKRLSDERANVIDAAIRELGVDSSRMRIQSKGATNEFGNMATKKGRRENRRTQITVLDDE